MIINQTTTLIFEYPQDYLQEQEWCKTKEDRWIHKGTDTLGAVYENTISYSIGQPSVSEKPTGSKDEPQICDTCRYYNSDIPCGSTPSACKEADKFAEKFVEGLKKLKPTISKMEQVDEPQIYCDTCGLNKKCKTAFTAEARHCQNESRFGKDEPQTCEECEHWSDTEDGCADRHGCTMTERSE